MIELENGNDKLFFSSKPKDKILFAMDLNALMVVEGLVKETNQPQERVLLDFMESNTAKMLYDDSTKLWWDGPSAIAEEFKQEKKVNKLLV